MSISASSDATPATGLDRRFYLAAWRWHFYAGLFVAPFLLILAVTGMTMMLIGYFDGREGERITVDVPASAQALPLTEQSQVVLNSFPGSKLVEWIRAPQLDRVNVFRIARADGGQSMVAVDPYAGNVVDSWNRRDGWYDFADNVHGELLLGTTGDTIIEIAAGFAIVLVITGLYMWWPRERSFLRTIIPDLRGQERDKLKSLHLSVGAILSVFLVLFLISGMSWTGVWGGKIIQAWSTFPTAKWDNVPLSDDTHAALNHDHKEDMPWALEQTPLPASGSDVGAAGIPEGKPIDLNSIAELATRLGFDSRYRVSFPRGEAGVWTMNQDTMSADAEDPFADKTVHVDQFTGKVLADVRFADYSLAGKAMAVSIPLHMGLVTVWNLLLNVIVCLGVIGLSLTGVIMWWLRRPKKMSARLFAPQLPQDMPHWKNAMLVMLIVSLAFPLVGATLIGLLVLDVLLLSRLPALRRIYA
ncbi:PepSY-associated TM helix domain-containing protein [Roseibium sp.]|uniref:PepSY-associated TM helix domain-containing protein n=1 Tax=Roseibium sp. TaxID=1936156 RepID=UPI003A9722B1